MSKNGHLDLSVPLRCVQIFDAVGLSTAFVNQYFTGTSTTIGVSRSVRGGGRGLRWHRNAYANAQIYRNLDVGGDYAFPPAR